MKVVNNKKYIFVTGGVISSLGKGIIASSLGSILEKMGHSVTILKCDPYINMDPGTMSPYQHGEVFVTDDGAETDLDVGHYERFTDKNGSYLSSMTTGQIYWKVLSKERKGDYLGATIQVIPHITDEIKNRIKMAGKKAKSDIVITEIGGTVGDIESLPFLEAIRQLKQDVGKDNVVYVHATYVPYIQVADELKTKPTQHSFRDLKSLGINPDIMVCRASVSIPQEQKEKIALFCDIDLDAVVDIPDVNTIYKVPMVMEQSELSKIVCRKLNIKHSSCKLTDLESYVSKIEKAKKKIVLGIVGKYVSLIDAYMSVNESIRHAAYNQGAKAEIKYIDSRDFKVEELKEVDGIIVPGGFGEGGLEGKLAAIKYARENKMPMLGICLGMQCICIEFARNVLGFEDANSTEFNSSTLYPIVDIMDSQKGIDNLGGTMRLGVYPCKLDKDSLSYNYYKDGQFNERHRHRYEFNNRYRDICNQKGLKIVGTSPDNTLVEMVEIEGHPWMVGAQFHPEFKSRPYRPHPLFTGLMSAILKEKKETKKKN